jgi:hypothetical protein
MICDLQLPIYDGRMDDYQECLPFLKSELERLERAEFYLSAESILEVMAAEGSPVADAAVREYAATLLWPQLEDRVRFELCLRLRVSIWWIESLSDTTTDQESLPVFLTDTMIDYWRDEGRTRWVWNHLVNPDIAL